MHKGLTLSIVLVLLVSSAAWAFISQDQLLQIGAGNGVLISGDSFDSATSTNVINAANRQDASSANGRVRAIQYEDGTLFQFAGVAGSGGAYGIDQQGTGVGAQAQQQNGLGLGSQNQALGVQLGQDMAAAGPDAYLGGIQGFVGHQIQVTLTPLGMSLNVSQADVVEEGAMVIAPNQALGMASALP